MRWRLLRRRALGSTLHWGEASERLRSRPGESSTSDAVLSPAALLVSERLNREPVSEVREDPPLHLPFLGLKGSDVLPVGDVLGELGGCWDPPPPPG